MFAPLLATKLYIPPRRTRAVSRPRLIDRLNAGLAAGSGLTLISASAGFGKTTLLSEWIASAGKPVAWLSLDEADNDPARFIAYLIAAVHTVRTDVGTGLLAALESPQPPQAETVLTSLLNDISLVPDDFLLILDDYHVIDSQPVDRALAFLTAHLPPQLHLVIATREDPPLPLARLRARGQLTELRAIDLRFTSAEAAEFLSQVMGLNLAAADVTALESRTEGWIAGLQLAAISMRGQEDATSFIKSFTGSHHFVLDYLVEEVLQRQPADIQSFLLRTSILDRMCGPLCDVVLHGDAGLHPAAAASGPEAAGRPSGGQASLEYLEHANLFVVPLDNERHWFRYHHLFADLLRQRLQRSGTTPAGETNSMVDELHRRASQWFEDQGLEMEAFQHAAAAHDIQRAERLIEAGGMPVYALGVASTILDWLDALPKTIKDARPWLWVRSAMSALMAGQTTGVEDKLQAAENAMPNADVDERTRDLVGQIAAIRATLAVVHYQPEVAITQARRALAHLHPDNRPLRSRATWALGLAYQIQGDRVSARQIYTEAIQQASGDTYHTALAAASLGELQESQNELVQAAQTYRQTLQLMSDQGPPNASEQFIGLARIAYEWNDLDAADQYGQQSLQLARQYDRTIDRFIASEVLLAQVKLARGDVDGAAAMLAQTEQSARQKNFTHRLPAIAAVQVLILLRQGQVAAAAQLARQYDLSLSQARVLIAQGNRAAALTVLEPFRQEAEARGWADALLKAMALQAVALHLSGDLVPARQVLTAALALAEPGGLIRLFVDEGEPMRELLADVWAQATKENRGQDHQQFAYVTKILAAFEEPAVTSPANVEIPPSTLPEPLSPRELEILNLMSLGLSNREIGERLFLALDTVKGHNRRIFDKLQVQRRTEAIARARELGLL